jgi:hypothetical protein
MGLGLLLGSLAQAKPLGLHGGHHRGIPKLDHGRLRPRNHIFESCGSPYSTI